MNKRTGRYEFVLRDAHPERGLAAGDVVALAKGQSIGRFCQTSSYLVEDTRFRVGFLPGTLLLPLELLFQRQPPVNCWFLVRSTEFWAGHNAAFLSDPRTLSYGCLPFRFDSFGEVVHTMRSRELRAEDHLVCQSRRLSHIRP